MTEKLSRRDAIKLLGAATGATLLANLPSKWSKPELVSGVLPAHAQTSCVAVFFEVLSATGDLGIIGLSASFQGPFPDSTTGTWNTGSTATWYCRPGCLQFNVLFFVDSGSVRITTLSNQFTLDPGNIGIRGVLIDMGTGAFALDGIGSAGSCNWVGA